MNTVRTLTFIEIIGTPKRYSAVDQLMVGVTAPILRRVDYQVNFMVQAKPKFRRVARLSRVKNRVLSQKRFSLKKITGLVASLVIAVSVVTAALLFAPSLYYMVFPAEAVPVVAETEASVLGGEFEAGAQATDQKEPYLPPKNENLPEGSWLVIPRIGVRTQLQPTENPEEALAKGVWQVPDFGTPGDTDLPMILAAHRYGYKNWWNGTDYWKYHSFYLLPDTEPGDTIEVIHDQRKWVYEIYAGELNQEITDYEADLILYTCKFLTGDDRHIRYARIIDPTIDTQTAFTL